MKSDLQKLMELEQVVSSGQRLNLAADDLGLKSYEARIVLGHGKMADTLCELSPQNEIQRLKSDIFCGNLSEARALAQKLLDQYAADFEVVREVTLELSRIYLYEGNWSLCLRTAQRASSFHPPLISQLTLWQLEAAAAGENGDTALALKRIEQVESLRHLFPGGNVLFYARNQKVKLLARQGLLDQAQRLLRDLWSECHASDGSKISLDPIETLSRCELELATLLKREASDWATLSRRCSRDSGEKLFEDIALADLALHHQTLARPISLGLLEKLLASPFQRVRDFIQKHQLQNLRATAVQTSDQDLAETLDFRFVYIPDRSLWIDIEERTRASIPADSVVARTLTHVFCSGSGLRIEDLFKNVYGLTYHKERHSGTVRTLLTRVRQATGLGIVAKDGKIHQDHPFLIVPRPTRSEAADPV